MEHGIKIIAAAQSYDAGNGVTVQHVYGLGCDGKVYEWDWETAEWKLWAKGG